MVQVIERFQKIEGLRNQSINFHGIVYVVYKHNVAFLLHYYYYSQFLAVLAEIAHPDQRFLLQDVLEDIDVPTLTLWGDNDKVRKLLNFYIYT